MRTVPSLSPFSTNRTALVCAVQRDDERRRANSTSYRAATILQFHRRISKIHPVVSLVTMAPRSRSRRVDAGIRGRTMRETMVVPLGAPPLDAPTAVDRAGRRLWFALIF